MFNKDNVYVAKTEEAHRSTPTWRKLRSHAIDRQMSWEHLESGRVNELPLDLYRSGDDYMIRVNGLELMNSRWPRSEKAMANIAKKYSIPTAAKILIGGLGLGFTLAEVMDEFLPPHQIVVAEQSADVVGWYQKYYRGRTVGDRDDSRVRFAVKDVRQVIADERIGFDLMLLDVDNGPEPVSGEGNAAIYSSEGLRQIRSRLRKGGTLLIWSAFESPKFLQDASLAGFQTHVHAVPVGHRDEQHYIFALT